LHCGNVELVSVPVKDDFPAFALGPFFDNCFPMTPAEARQRHAQIAAEIRALDHAYYVEARPVVSDREYDRLYHELLDLEKNFPDLVTPDSPSQRLSSRPASAADAEPG
jgi:NAD-dependent DNA ligase